MRSAGQPAAIDDQIRARYVGGAIASEEHGSVGYILRPPQPRPRCTPARVFNQRGILSNTGPAGLDFSRRDAVTDNEVLCIVTGNLPRDVDSTGLADTIRSLTRASHDALLRTEVDDPPACLIPRLLANHLLHGPLLGLAEALRQTNGWPS